MRSPRKATIIFVAILLLFLLSFVSGELNKRDPQAPGKAPPDDGKAPPPDDVPPPADGKAPPADGKAPPADGKAPPADGKAPPADGKAPPADGKAPPADGKAPPADGKAPPADGKAPPADGKTPPADGKTPPADGKTPPADGKTPPADGKNAPPTDTNTTNVNPLTPPVQVQIIDPKPAKNILFKIGSNITFRWNYTSKFADPPKSINVMAQSQLDTKTFYSIAKDLALNATIQEAVWVTAREQSLPMAKYNLLITDERGANATPKPGGLQIFSGLQFGLYVSQTTDTCPSCDPSSAIPTLITPLSSIICLTLITTIISSNFILNNFI